jgi:uncharacterized membrane protein YeiH
MTERTHAGSALPNLSDDLLAKLESTYRDLHANPELSMQEQRTSGIAADWLRQCGYEVTEPVGGTGVVGLLRNGDGPTVLLRADMDALPIKENTGLAYASDKTGTDRFGQATAVAHSCGHDMHVAWLMGATRILAENRGGWHGTVMAVFQPGEETAQGARAMIADGMIKRFPKPAVTLGQHVMPLSAGQIGWRIGTMLSAGDSLEVTLFGRGAHGSMPQKSIDPVVMAASAVMRLQTVVSREVAMTDSAVVTVGTLRAGMNENPPATIGNWHDFAIAIGAGLLTFFAYPMEQKLDSPVQVLDAIGLGVFAVTGAQKSLSYGINPVIAPVLGMISGIGGGMTRDVLAGEIPFVLRKDLYAIAALAAGVIVTLGNELGLPPLWPMLLGLGACIFLRVMAIFFGWRAPVSRWARGQDRGAD